MIVRFCLYSIFKNLRFFEPFLVLYLLSGRASGGPGLLYFEVGALIGYQKFLTGLLEIPSGAATDRWGRRRALIGCFLCYLGAFPVFALSSRSDSNTIVTLYLGMTLFAIGEAFRTGSHKAIMLDWLEENGRLDEATRVVGLTRFFSKVSAGISAVVGGVLVYATGRFDVLFWAATIPALLGLAVVSSYPRWLEGEQSRAPELRTAGSWTERVQALWAVPGTGALMIQSVVFESQIKLAQHYVQPFFKSTLEHHSIAVLGGVGALVVGLYYLIQDVLGGTASLFAPRVQSWWGGASRANRRTVHLAPVIVFFVALGLFQDGYVVAIVSFVLLAVLQNVRRPIFLSLLNQFMDKPQRATTLSIESQARSWTFAILAPVTGLVADHFGLSAALILIAGLLATAGVADLMPRRSGPGREP